MYCTPGNCTYRKKTRKLKKFFELKRKGYRDGIKRKETQDRDGV